jgi:tetratricopeptide (TPR) repeat protein
LAGTGTILALAASAWHQTTYWRDTETLFTHALHCTTRNGIAHYRLGLAAEEKHQFDEAARQYQLAIEAAPTRADAYNQLANILLYRGDTNSALEHYRIAIRLCPSSRVAYLNCATVLDKQAKYEEAAMLYQKALDFDPGDLSTRNNLARTLELQGRYDKAVAQYQQSLKLAPNNFEALAKLGMCQLRVGNFDSAIVALGRASEIISNTDPAILCFLAEAQKGLGKLPEALATARLGLRAANLRNNKAVNLQYDLQLNQELEDLVRACSADDAATRVPKGAP